MMSWLWKTFSWLLIEGSLFEIIKQSCGYDEDRRLIIGANEKLEAWPERTLPLEIKTFLSEWQAIQESVFTRSNLDQSENPG